jgi:hypothetical protein
MKFWTKETLETVTYNFKTLSYEDQLSFIEFMNNKFPPPLYSEQISSRRSALNNMEQSRNQLKGVVQKFPSFIEFNSIAYSQESLQNHAVVLTAGGEGERLRLSLLQEGVAPELLKDFTKATFALPGFYNQFGTLHANLCMISSICAKYNLDIPVIVTTGPQDSITAEVIPEILKKHNNFGLKSIMVVEQDERLHFTNDEKIVCQFVDGKPAPVTQPDETGGPLMKLKARSLKNEMSPLDWLKTKGCTKLIVVQATALYDLNLLPAMAKALDGHDCLGVGILRTDFPEKDPFGTFVSLCKGNHCTVMIIEQDVRNETTRQVKDSSGRYYLPYNTGFYGFDIDLLVNNNLPDFATPPKEITPELPRSSKIGYAATDLLPLSLNPVILSIDTSKFRVLKTSADLKPLSEMGKKNGLEEICKKVIENGC